MKKTCLLSAFLAFAAYTSAFAATVPGWPTDRLAMGTATDGGQLQALEQRPVDSIFSYAGINGSGDRGQEISFDTKADKIMKQARQLEHDKGIAVRPVYVFYSVDGSDGVWSMQQDLNIDPTADPNNLAVHYANLIWFAKQLESYKDAQHPVPATVILNPDFLGELHKQCGQYYCPIPFTQAIPVASSLTKALQFVNIDPATIETLVPTHFLNGKSDSLVGYIQSINWIMHTFAPDVPFGWQDNVWAGDPNGHLWIHQATHNPTVLASHISDETSFLTQMGVMVPPANYPYPFYASNFIVFDKWERDVFDSNLGGAGVNNGYLYNAADWDVYMQYVSGISHNFNNIPVMLWQIPGGHIQIVNDIDNRNNHGSTAPDYFLGDDKLAISATGNNVANYIASSTFKTPSTYQVTSPSVMSYLTCPTTNQSACWQQNRLADLQKNNVFAILWGGGSTTGIVGVNPALDDNGWLYDHLKPYMQQSHTPKSSAVKN